MSIDGSDRETGRRPPSQKVRIAAARVRVESDRQVRRDTPQWIKDLADSGREK